jgi:PAS domain S-box-containing protein
VWAFLLLQSPADAQLRETRRVVILNDLGIISSPGFAEVDQAIFAGLQKSQYQIELYHESLELTLFPDEVSQRRFREEFVRKYTDRRPDIIVAAGSGSLQFIAESKDMFLQEVPTVFCAILGEVPARSNSKVPFTGVLGRLHPKNTLDVALHLFPRTKHVVVVGGMGKFDRNFEDVATQSFENYATRVDFTYLTDLTMPALLERLRQLPADTIVYHTAITKDATGQRFIDSAQSVPLVARASNAPVFVMDDVDLRGGTLGGDLVNWADDGRVAAEMAVRILNGEKPQDIPIVTSRDDYMFDWRALRRWGIAVGDLPSGSIVLNRPPSFWQVYRRYIVVGVLVLLAQTLAIVALLWQRRKRKRTEADLRESERRFRLVANTAPVMIWMSGPDKLRTYFNQPWLDFTGRPFEAEFGEGWLQGMHADDRKAFLDTYTRAFDERAPFRKEYRLRRRDGEYRWVFAQGVPRFDGDGSFVGYIGSCIDVTERKAAEEAVASLSGRLIEAQEEECKRIAREIHDDFNQRLAMVAIDLDEISETIKGSSFDGASERLHEIFDRVSELGADLHSLSHTLHSSTLENLGLIAGMRTMCAEFAEQQELQIEFGYMNVPADVPGDVALCLFRIGQEGLRNVKRHSGADRAQVCLEGFGDGLRLSVSDRGKGMDPNKPASERGIGIRSMEERLRLLGGQLEIHSSPQEGTTVDAWVPLKTSKAA